MQQRSHPTHRTFQQQQSAKAQQYGSASMQGVGHRSQFSAGADARSYFFYAENINKLFLQKNDMKESRGQGNGARPIAPFQNQLDMPLLTSTIMQHSGILTLKRSQTKRKKFSG